MKYVFLQVQEADIDGDQHVSFEEFRDIFNEGWTLMVILLLCIQPVLFASFLFYSFIQGEFFTGPPPKSLKYRQINLG